MLLFIHRRDLRVEDLAAFDYIRSRRRPSLHLLILDPLLLENGREEEASGRNFLGHVVRLSRLYEEAGKRLHLLYGDPAKVVERVLQAHPIEELVLQRDVTPYARHRDRKLREKAEERGCRVTTAFDHSLADLTELQAYSGRSGPYKVFTPFYRKWSEYLTRFYRPTSSVGVADLETADLAAGVAESFRVPFDWRRVAEPEDPERRMREFFTERLAGYAMQRDRYAGDGTSLLSPHLSVGALSIRRVFEEAVRCPQHEPWVRQLAWRDFYIYQGMYDPHFFEYEKRFDFAALSDRHFDAWRRGETGIPLVDAAMTQLAETGQMPNRLRMVAAMFLTKNLLCPFTLGEQYFRSKLADYDNVQNRGGWLWSSSLGFDAAPYFRVMNPASQSAALDPNGAYIRRWLPKLAEADDRSIHQPQPHAIVDLKASRARAIEVYRGILGSGAPEANAQLQGKFE